MQAVEPDIAEEGGATAPRTRERSLDRVAQILEFLHTHGEAIAVGDLSRELRAPRSTTYNLVKSLMQAGLLEEVGESGRIFFGKRLYLYGMDYMRENPLVRRGREAVDRLSRETGETAELCMLQSGRYTIVHMCPGTRPFRISSAVGLQIPLPWTASGRLLLSGMGRRDIERLVSDGDRILPDGREIDLDAFLDSIAEAKRVGHSITSGIVDAFTMCLAAPVHGQDGQVDATLCLVVPIDTADTRREELLSVLLSAARGLSMMI